MAEEARVKLWEKFSITLRDAGLRPENYVEEFNWFWEDVKDLPFERQRALLEDLTRSIVARVKPPTLIAPPTTPPPPPLFLLPGAASMARLHSGRALKSPEDLATHYLERPSLPPRIYEAWPEYMLKRFREPSLAGIATLIAILSIKYRIVNPTYWGLLKILRKLTGVE